MMEEKLKAAEAANERDRSIVAAAFNAIRDAISAYDWATEGRGPYEWNDDQYREVFKEALDAIAAAAEPLRKIASDLEHCPINREEVIAARNGQGAYPPKQFAMAIMESRTPPTATPRYYRPEREK